MAKLQSIGRTLKVEVLQPLADKLAPVLSDLATWVGNNIPNIVKGIESVVDAVKNVIKFIDLISPALAGIATAIAGLALAGLIQNIGAVGTALKAWAMSTKVVTAAQWLLNAALNANPISLVVIAIAGLVTAFVVLWNKSEAFRNFWINLWNGIKKVTATVVKEIGEFFK